MRQFQNVSISPWANPYSADATASAGKGYHAPATAPQPYQPLLRRPPTFFHPDVVQIADEEGNGAKAGMLDTCSA